MRSQPLNKLIIDKQGSFEHVRSKSKDKSQNMYYKVHQELELSPRSRVAKDPRNMTEISDMAKLLQDPSPLLGKSISNNQSKQVSQKSQSTVNT